MYDYITKELPSVLQDLKELDLSNVSSLYLAAQHTPALSLWNLCLAFSQIKAYCNYTIFEACFICKLCI